jgi:hypothetical protein
MRAIFIRRMPWAAAFALAGLVGTFAQAQDTSSAPGVNPKDNITKTEVLFRYDNLNLGDYSQSITLKFDKAFNAQWGANVEVPFVAYKGFGLDQAGLGDIQARIRYTGQWGRLSTILGAELVMPTATDDALGRGKYQFNPAVGAVYPVSQTSFVFLGYKHFLSFAGDDARPDINESQPRILGAYVSPQGWWMLGDLKYTKSWETEVEQVDVDLEYGRMIAPATGVWVRAGTSYLDSDRDFGVLVGIRFIN